MKPIILFLDFDGVLLPVPRRAEWPRIPPAQYVTGSDWSVIETIARSLESYGDEVRVVVSSSWRLMIPLDELQALLAQLRVDAVTGKSQDTRYEELRAFMYPAGGVARPRRR